MTAGYYDQLYQKPLIGLVARLSLVLIVQGPNDVNINFDQDCAPAEPGGPWRLTFVLGHLAFS